MPRANHYQSLFISQRALWNVVDAWHSNIGAAILDNWAIAEDIRDAVQNFGNLEYVHRGSFDLTDVIFAADLLDAHFDERSHRKLDWENPPGVIAKLNLNEEKCAEMNELMKIELDAFMSAIN